MATYFIGDVHGCLPDLLRLVASFDYDPVHDHLWFAGDLVNRGPASLDTLRWVKAQPNAHTVLGNHDLHMLALYHGALPAHKKHDLYGVLAAPDVDVLMAWLRTCPFYHCFAEHRLLLVHAGFYPGWSLTDLKACGDDVHQAMQRDPIAFFATMYGDLPNRWHPDLDGAERLRFIVNAMTRMRYVDATYRLDLEAYEAPPHANSQLMPWFEALDPTRLDAHTCLFGHWAALRGQIASPYVLALDGGCVWDGRLLAWCLETQTWFHVTHQVDA